MQYINVDDVFISFAPQESLNRNQNNKAMIIDTRAKRLRMRKVSIFNN